MSLSFSFLSDLADDECEEESLSWSLDDEVDEHFGETNMDPLDELDECDLCDPDVDLDDNDEDDELLGCDDDELVVVVAAPLKVGSVNKELPKTPFRPETSKHEISKCPAQVMIIIIIYSSNRDQILINC